MSSHSSALCSLILFKQFLFVRYSANKHFLVKMPKFSLCSTVCINLLNIIWKSKFMNSNVLQCDTLVAVLLQVVVA